MILQVPFQRSDTELWLVNNKSVLLTGEWFLNINRSNGENIVLKSMCNDSVFLKELVN